MGGKHSERGRACLSLIAIAPPPRSPPFPFPSPLPFTMVSFPDLTKADGLAALDKHLATKSYVEGCVQKREGHRGGRRQGNKTAAPRRPRAGVGGDPLAAAATGGRPRTAGSRGPCQAGQRSLAHAPPPKGGAPGAGDRRLAGRPKKEHRPFPRAHAPFFFALSSRPPQLPSLPRRPGRLRGPGLQAGRRQVRQRGALVRPHHGAAGGEVRKKKEKKEKKRAERERPIGQAPGVTALPLGG